MTDTIRTNPKSTFRLGGARGFSRFVSFGFSFYFYFSGSRGVGGSLA
ncbi:MAG: hypothetical protein ACKVX9_00525 [Blastocatellia bacterium]